MYFVGNYGVRDRIILKLNVKEEGQLIFLFVIMLNSQKQLYVYIFDGLFVNEVGMEKLVFIMEENGKIYLWFCLYVLMKGLGQLVIFEYKVLKLDILEVFVDVIVVWEECEGK